jgi:hypothetical protein
MAVFQAGPWKRQRQLNGLEVLNEKVFRTFTQPCALADVCRRPPLLAFAKARTKY